MMEAAERGRQTFRQNKIEISERKKLDYLADPKLCLACKNIITFEKRGNAHCSMSCASVTRNTGVRRHGNPGEVTNCQICGSLTKPGNIYCSQSCSGKRVKFDIGDWLSGKISGNTALGCSAAIKRYLLEQCNHKCPKCGWGEVHPVTGNVPLETNHIDGDSKNNRPDNLEILCPNCHSLTPNFRALNKRSSRTHRGLRSP